MSREAFRGCLLGGAVGDALGAPLEFDSLPGILDRFGPAGLTDYAPAYGRIGAVTDDTQMTLFTAEGLLRAASSGGDVVRMTHRAYLRWLVTQGGKVAFGQSERGWLATVPELQSRRAPGKTCLSALQGGARGTKAEPLNDSKGCGGVMRMAPAGLAAQLDPFGTGANLAALTHGHPSGYLSAGFLAQLVAELVAGSSLRGAAESGLSRLRGEEGHEETSESVQAALEAAAEGDPSAGVVQSLGAGWVGEEALAIGLYCALVARDFEHGVLLAVNHGGDSDSTGSIAGNLLGLIHGEGGIPARWLERLELCEVITTVADDLWAAFGPEKNAPDLLRYPPN
jgi:ADP-ribosylglycohydrolase